jgi:anti-sigma regulatory factor (Ser/Thr protein kinase)
MPKTAIHADIMIALVLASDPGQVGMARCLVRAALEYRGLGHYASEAEIIASELVTNAIQHASSADPVADKIGVTLVRVWDGEAISVVVTDPSPAPPVKRETTAGSERGRGLQIVEALSAHWGWNHEQRGKAVYAILAKEDAGHDGRL